MKARFVKGHCGWDVVSVLPAGDVPRERELAVALSILDGPAQGGLEVGFLEAIGPGALRLRVVDSTTRDWITVCGGITQVIGKALVETFMREQFGIDVMQPALRVELVTESAVVPIEVEIVDGHAARVTTTMDGYAEWLYAQGVERLVLDGVPALATADFLVIGVEALEARYPGLDFTRRDFGPHLDRVNALLKAFAEPRGGPLSVNAMLWDARPDGGGDFRLYPRFLSEDMSAARVPYEFQCGSGTVAVGVALAELGMLPARSEVSFEWGNSRVTPDPYGIRVSRFGYRLDGTRLASARFTHSVVEIIAEGVLHLGAG